MTGTVLNLHFDDLVLLELGFTAQGAEGDRVEPNPLSSRGVHPHARHTYRLDVSHRRCWIGLHSDQNSGTLGCLPHVPSRLRIRWPRVCHAFCLYACQTTRNFHQQGGGTSACWAIDSMWGAARADERPGIQIKMQSTCVGQAGLPTASAASDMGPVEPSGAPPRNPRRPVSWMCTFERPEGCSPP